MTWRGLDVELIIWLKTIYNNNTEVPPWHIYHDVVYLVIGVAFIFLQLLDDFFPPSITLAKLIWIQIILPSLRNFVLYSGIKKMHYRRSLCYWQSLSIPVLGSPAFDKTHANGAHPGQLIYSLKALVHWLSQQCRKLLVIEDLQVTA